jgi:hypothetical protein
VPQRVSRSAAAYVQDLAEEGLGPLMAGRLGEGLRRRHLDDLPFAQPMNTFDEYVLFQGASDFRARGVGYEYGLSARGLAINTALPPRDKFPMLNAVYIMKPATQASDLTVFALLDSESTAGIYKFTIAIADATLMSVSCTIFGAIGLRVAPPHGTMRAPRALPLERFLIWWNH